MSFTPNFCDYELYLTSLNFIEFEMARVIVLDIVVLFCGQKNSIVHNLEVFLCD